MVNLALVGLGNIGLVHATVLREPTNKSGIVLKAIADPTPKEIYKDTIYFKHYRELLREKDITAVSIATPPHTHYQITLDALNAYKDVLLEKPPTLTIEQLETLARTASDNDLVLFTAFHTRYRSEVALAFQELKNKNVRKIEINYREYVLNYHDPAGWIFNPDMAGGGVLIDSGINAMSVVQRVLPGLEFQVTSAKLFRSSDYRVETNAHVDFTFGRDSQGVLRMDWFHKGAETRQISFYTDSAKYTIDIVQSQLFKNDKPLLDGEKKERVTADLYIEYRSVYDDFAKHLAERKSLVSAKELKFVLDTYSLVKRKN